MSAGGLGVVAEQVLHVGLVVDLEHQLGQLFELGLANRLAGTDSLEDRVLAPSARCSTYSTRAVLDQVEPLEAEGCRSRRPRFSVGDVEDLRQRPTGRRGLLVLHDAAQVAPQLLEMVDLDRGPEVLAADLIDGVGLRLDRVLVLGEQLDSSLDARPQILDLRRLRPALEQLDLERVIRRSKR